MKYRFVFMFVLLAMLLVSSTFGESTEMVQNGDFAQGLEHWTTSRAAEVEVVDAADVPAGHSFAKAARVTIAEKPDKPWTVQLRQVLSASLTAGQWIELNVMMRSPQEATLLVGVQETAAGKFRTVGGKRITLTPQWKRYTIKRKVPRNVAAEGSQLVLNLGFDQGVIEIADLSLTVSRSVKQKAYRMPPTPSIELQSLPVENAEQFSAGSFKSLVSIDRPYWPNNETGRQQLVDVEGPYFTQAAEVTTLKSTPSPYNFQYLTPVLGPVQEGDVLVAVFAFRVTSPNALSGYGQSEVVFEKAGPPHTKSLIWGLSQYGASGEWQVWAIPFRSLESYGPEGASLVFRAGYGEQTVQIGGLYLINLGQDVALEDLPQPKRRYGGDEPDAAWRTAAQQRIEKIRKGNLNVRVVDENGQPVRDATVHVNMLEHAFGFGSAMRARALIGQWSGDDAQQYVQTAEQNFNWGVLENWMKWIRYSQPDVPAEAQAAVTWMRDRNWQVRGHAMIWPSWRRNPKALAKLQNDPSALRQAVAEHIRQIGEDFAGELVAWDVINEPFKNHQIMDILGDEVMADWFKIARQADPHAQLFVNDNGLLSNPARRNPKVAYYLDLIDMLRNHDAEVDGIGMQGHFAWSLTDMDRLLEVCDLFADKGVRIHVTEFDVTLNDEELQARYTRDFLTAMFSHPAVDAILLWGFWEGAHWKPEAAMFRKDWTIKPNGKVWRELTRKTWWTDETKQTNADGRCEFRGFLGDYEITATVDGREVHRNITLTHDGSNITLHLDTKP